MDRYLVAGAILLLFLEVSFLISDLNDHPWWRSSHASSESGQVIGRLAKLENQVRRRNRASLVWNESRLSEDLIAYDSVLTLAGSSAQIELYGGTKLELDENTLVVLEPSSQSENGSLKIRFSRGLFRSANPSSTVRVETGEWTLNAEKGASLSLMSLADGRFSVEVDQGSAVIESKSGTESVQAGDRVFVKDSKIEEKVKLTSELAWNSEIPTRVYASEFPVDLDLAWSGLAQELKVIHPDKSVTRRALSGEVEKVSLNEGTFLMALENQGRASSTLSIQVRRSPVIRYFAPLPRDRVESGKDVLFAWEAVPQASKYRLEISDHDDFATLVESEETQEPRLFKRLNKEGRVYWRVVAFDADEIAMPSLRVYPLDFTLDPIQSPQLHIPEIRKPASPTEGETFKGSFIWNLIFPRAEATTKKKFEAHFSWDPVGGANEYVIEISKTPGFEDPILIQKVNQTQYIWSGFDLGTYYWRVAADKKDENGKGRLGLFSPLSIANLQNPSVFAGEGVTISEVKAPEKVKSKSEVELIKESPKEMPREKPKEAPKTAQISDVQSQAVDSQPALKGSRIQFYLVPTYRWLESKSDTQTSAVLAGFVPVSMKVAADVRGESGETWQVTASYMSVKWKPQGGGRFDQRQNDLSDSQWKWSLAHQPNNSAWSFGLGLESFIEFERVSALSGQLKEGWLIGPTFSRSVPLANDHQARLAIDLRSGQGLNGVRLQGQWHRHLLRDTQIDDKNNWIFGPSASYGYFIGSESRRLQEIQAMFELGFEW